MAKEGKKLELYEILAAKRAKGKAPLALDAKPARQANQPAEDETQNIPEPSAPSRPTVIVDDAVADAYPAYREQPQAEEKQYEAVPEKKQTRIRERPVSVKTPVPEPEPRPKSPREVVFALDTAFIFFTIVLALVGSSYFLGYKRGQEERPAGLAGIADIETGDPERFNIGDLAPAPRPTMKPSEQDYTLILRGEPANGAQLERLELELAEAVARGKQAGSGDIPSFIFRVDGNEPRYYLTVGLGASANDQELNRLLQIYNKLEGMTLSREPRPYISCQIAQVNLLGALIY